MKLILFMICNLIFQFEVWLARRALDERRYGAALSASFQALLFLGMIGYVIVAL